jgi:hypothetical protein
MRAALHSTCAGIRGQALSRIGENMLFFVFSDFVIFACAPTDTSNMRRGIPPGLVPKKS